MRSLVVALGFLVCAMPAVAGKTPPPPLAPAGSLENVLTMRVDGLVTLDAKGNLLNFVVETPIPENVRIRLDGVVLRWRFSPTIVDSAKGSLTTRMRITLAATPDGNNYRVRVDNVIFPGEGKVAAPRDQAPSPDTITAKRLTPPGYPIGLMRQGVSGRVLLGLHLDADGRVVEVVPVQTLLKDVRGKPEVLAKAIQLFEESAVVAARRWTFNMPSDPRAQGDRTVNLPVNYTADRDDKTVAGQWSTEVRTARREMGWLDGRAGLQRAGVSDVADGETISVASAVHLETDVIGAIVL
jgi:hypothetical protein